jgi:hypothetical protein
MSTCGPTGHCTGRSARFRFARPRIRAAELQRSAAVTQLMKIPHKWLSLYFLLIIIQISCAASHSKKWRNYEDEIVIAVVHGQVSSMYEAEGWRLRTSQPHTRPHIYIALTYNNNFDPTDKVMRSLSDPNILFWKHSEGQLYGRQWGNKTTRDSGMILEINEAVLKGQKKSQFQLSSYQILIVGRSSIFPPL